MDRATLSSPEVSPFGDLGRFPSSAADSAAMLWDRGFRVVPFRMSDGRKQPLVRQWKPYTESRSSVVASVGRTGAYGVVVPPGLIVVDLDTRDAPEGESAYLGLDSLIDLALDNGITSLDYLNTLTVDTPRGGMHLWYRIPNEIIFKNSASTVAKGVDVRVPNDGLVLLPPSCEPGKLPYIFSPHCTVITLPLWLMNAIRKAGDKTKEIGTAIKALDYQTLVVNKDHAKYLEKRCDSVAYAGQGMRNNSLNAVAYSVFRRVYGGLIDEYAAETALHNAGLRSGLRENETKATIASAKRAAASAPVII